MNVDAILDAIKDKYKNEKVNDIDGVKIDFADEWVHLRKSNTEPIIRIYSESKSETTAEHLAKKIMKDISELCI
jgi:phosphomannomutase